MGLPHSHQVARKCRPPLNSLPTGAELYVVFNSNQHFLLLKLGLNLLSYKKNRSYQIMFIQETKTTIAQKMRMEPSHIQPIFGWFATCQVA